MSSYGGKDQFREYYPHTKAYGCGVGYFNPMKPHKYVNKVAKKDPGAEQKKKILHW